MPQLDRFVALMLERAGTALRLETGQPIGLDVGGAVRPVTKDPLSSPQILALIREILPDQLRVQLESDDARLAFDYLADGHNVDVETARAGDRVHANIYPARPRRSTAAISVPADALLMETKPSATPPATHQDVAVTSRAEERIQDLLRFLVESDSSDLHLRVELPPMYRTHGELKEKEGEPPLTREDIEQMVFAIMPDRNKQEYAETNDTDFAYEMLNLARFRANGLRDRKGMAAVFRVIPTEILTVDQLSVTAEVQKLCYLTKGLVVVTGPTGSGKSTTLAALVDLINRNRTDHIITIEDPIEFVHPNKKCVVTQRQVGSHTQSFKRALRAALREDPDIILIGEMRDLETVAIAIETAETGHLVFGTLHTTTAVSTVDRIIDQFPADRQEQIRVMLSESLKGVVAQVLCKKIGGGRIAAREILLSIGAVANLIREGKTFQLPSILQTNKKIGMTTLNDSLVELVDQKLVEPEEAYMKSVDKPGLETAFKSRGIRLQLRDA
jgi:twitching motility protein PilT